MTRKLILKASATALALVAAVTAGPVWAESGFKALEGIEASPLSADEMESVQGKYFQAYATVNALQFWSTYQVYNVLPILQNRYDFYYMDTGSGTLYFWRQGDYIRQVGVNSGWWKIRY